MLHVADAGVFECVRHSGAFESHAQTDWQHTTSSAADSRPTPVGVSELVDHNDPSIGDEFSPYATGFREQPVLLANSWHQPKRTFEFGPTPSATEEETIEEEASRPIGAEETEPLGRRQLLGYHRQSIGECSQRTAEAKRDLSVVFR